MNTHSDIKTWEELYALDKAKEKNKISAICKENSFVKFIEYTD